MKNLLTALLSFFGDLTFPAPKAREYKPADIKFVAYKGKRPPLPKFTRPNEAD